MLRLSSVTVLLVVTLVMAGCGSGSENPGEQPTGSPTTREGGVEDYARHYFPDRFAGVEAVSGNRIIVYRTGSAPEFDRSIRSHFPQLHITFEDAPYTLRRLLDLRNRIVDDMDYWRARGIDIQSVGPQADGTAVVVGVPKADLEKAHRRLPRRYEQEIIMIRQLSVDPATDDPNPIAPLMPASPSLAPTDSSKDSTSPPGDKTP